MKALREMTKRKSILPLQPGGCGSKSGGMPMSGNAASVVEVLELPSPEPLPVEVLEEPPVVELAPAELVSSGREVTPGVVVKLVVVPPGPLQARPTRDAATTMERVTMAPKYSAKARRGQAHGPVVERRAARPWSGGQLSDSRWWLISLETKQEFGGGRSMVPVTAVVSERVRRGLQHMDLVHVADQAIVDKIDIHQ